MTEAIDTPGTVDDTIDDTVDDLVLDLLEWVGPGTRPYDEVMEAWRTSCPRLPVWEEAKRRALVVRRDVPGLGPHVSVSRAGWEYLRARRPAARA